MNSCCSCCFESPIGSCIPADGYLTINTQLDPAQTYWYHFTDKFQNEYSGELSPESDGTLKIPIAQLPDGLLNQYAGDFMLSITADEQGCDTVPLLLAAKYDCIQLSVTGKNSKSNIGCSIPTSPVGGPKEFHESEFSTEFN